MHHRAAGLLTRAELRERIRLDLEVVAVPITPPLDRDEAVREILEGLRVPQRQTRAVVARVREVGALAFDARVEGFGEGVVDDA